MVEYGYINENGCLTSKFLEEYTEKYRDEESGELKERTVSVEDQIESLSAIGWKPVDLIDETQFECAQYYSVSFSPYDAGDRIGYIYNQVFDTKMVKEKISSLKKMLTSTDSNIGDYRITKCYEASLIGLDMPYDIAELHHKRQAVRDEINLLEELLKTNDKIDNDEDI